MLNPIADLLVSIQVWLYSWLELDRVDKKLFENQNKMRLFPHSAIKGRTQVLLLVLLADKLIYGTHIFL
ncbi:hypothetical protein BLA29_015447, partial [Euroglyphus maynei]